MKATALILALVFLGSFTAFAQDRTGNELLEDCQVSVHGQEGANLSGGQMVQAPYCLGYIAGIADTAALWKADARVNHQPIPQLAFCPDSGVSFGQMTRVVVKWLEDHPKHLNKPAGVLALIALHDAWPCAR